MEQHFKNIVEELSNIEYNTREQSNIEGNTIADELHQIQWQLTRIANTLEQMAKTKQLF